MSNYRDDRDALRERADSFERALAEKEREVEALRGDQSTKQKLEEAEHLLAQVQGQLANLRAELKPEQKPASNTRLFIVLGVGAIAAAGAGWLFTSHPAPTPPAPFPAVAKPSAPPTNNGPIGVPECDEAMARAKTCDAPGMDAIRGTEDSYRQLAKVNRASAEKACKAILETIDVMHCK